MAIDISHLHLLNVADTCAIWNVLSSKVLYSATMAAKCVFSCTRFVHYECLLKPRTQVTEDELELLNRLKIERERGNFKDYHIEIDDLNDMEVLEKRRNLSKGELSSMIFAKRTRQAFLTDDQGARKLACKFLEARMVQTTPHIFGWLIYAKFLGDLDKDSIIEEHRALGRPLEPYFKEAYLRALESRLAHSTR